jgi:hypothetical protein
LGQRFNPASVAVTASATFTVTTIITALRNSIASYIHSININIPSLLLDLLQR